MKDVKACIHRDRTVDVVRAPDTRYSAPIRH